MIYKINSSNISMIDYEPNDLTLTVYFKNGNVYNYYPIYENQVMDFSSATSKGRWFNQNIRNNKSLGVKKIK